MFFTYLRRELRGVDLVIVDGEWLAVQGRTGHGKTTVGKNAAGDRATSP